MIELNKNGSVKIKKYILIFIVFTAFLISCAAKAEIVGKTADGFIHRYIASNGQEIYFVSTGQEALVNIDTDVNFDGYPDLTVVTNRGASNFFYEFFLWNGKEYEYAEYKTDDIVNFYPAYGKYIVSERNDGSAGALFKTQICIWDGNILKAVRTMVSEEETVADLKDNIFITTTYLDKLHVRLWEENPSLGEAVIIWEKTYDSFPENQEDFYEMQTQLWNGLI
jgi:hypothetical protein